MPSRPSNCPRCLERLPEAASGTLTRYCPRCGASLDQSAEGSKASKKQRSWPSAIVAVVALAVIARAGVVIYQKVSALSAEEDPAGVIAQVTQKAPDPDMPDPDPPGPERLDSVTPRPQAETKDEAPHWSHNRLVVVRDGQDAGNRPVVVLGHPTGVLRVGQTRGVQKGLLAREIIRQAVLLAARDELGLSTRDEVLGDASPTGKGNASADVAALVRLNGPASVKIGRDDPGGKGVLLDRDLLPPAPGHDLIDLARAAEKLSRTDFPKALRLLGLEGKPNTIRADADLPGSVENRLASLGFVEPLMAVRDLHAAIRDDGESPERLGALVRSYARLGVLNEFLWSPAHKVFKARALLYAHRLIARDPKSPWGYWHRAYVEALVGLHKRALDDIAKAEKLASGKDTPTAPAWVGTIAAYCHFDLARLKKIGGSQTKLAALLRLLALEFPRHGDVPLHAAKELLANDPECFRAHDVMYKVGGVANLHEATMLAPQVLTEAVPRRLRAVGTLPESVREPIDRNAGEVALVDALERAGRPGADAGEPSWAVLGSLIRETRFVHVQHRLYFMRYSWSVPVEEFWNEARPLVARHRYQPYLLTLAFGTPEADQAFADSFDDSRFPDLELTEDVMINQLGQVAENKRKQAWRLTQLHMDHLVRDFATQCDLYSKEHKEIWIHNANKILGLSPENPYAMSILIEVDGEHVQPQLADWEKKGADFPPLLGALGRRYSELRQYEKARDFLERYLKESPESWAYERLATNYKEQGDTDRWLATLDQYLASGEDHGLDHARVRVVIANYYMTNQMWEKAQPYAEAAAETWANWAMQCAVRCYTGMKDWERAELWVQRVSERYPNTSVREWLDFCKRTGHGNLEAAQALVKAYEAAVGGPGPGAVAGQVEAADPLAAGFTFWLNGSTKEAMESFHKAYEARNTFQAGSALMILADERGDLAERNVLLGDLCTRHRAKAPRLIAVLQLFRDSFARGDGELPDLEALNGAVESVKPNLRGNTEFYAGSFLRNHGKRQEAETYLRRCIQTPSTNAWLKRLATDALQRTNGDPVPAKADPSLEK